MKKVYPVVKIYSILIGIMTFWFLVGSLAVMFSPEIENKFGAVFLIIVSILGIMFFFRSLKIRNSADNVTIWRHKRNTAFIYSYLRF